MSDFIVFDPSYTSTSFNRPNAVRSDRENTNQTSEAIVQTFRNIGMNYQILNNAKLLIEQGYRRVPEFSRLKLKQHGDILDISIFVNARLNYSLFKKLNTIRVQLEDSLKDFYLDINYIGE